MIWPPSETSRLDSQCWQRSHSVGLQRVHTAYKRSFARRTRKGKALLETAKRAQPEVAELPTSTLNA